MLADFATDDASRGSYYLNFILKLRGNLLNGSVIAVGPSGVGRYGSAPTLAHWVELKRSDTDQKNVRANPTHPSRAQSRA